jgi:hypothetical protein
MLLRYATKNLLHRRYPRAFGAFMIIKSIDPKQNEISTADSPSSKG